jgi:hypothetical protein
MGRTLEDKIRGKLGQGLLQNVKKGRKHEKLHIRIRGLRIKRLYFLPHITKAKHQL